MAHAAGTVRGVGSVQDILLADEELVRCARADGCHQVQPHFSPADFGRAGAGVEVGGIESCGEDTQSFWDVERAVEIYSPYAIFIISASTSFGKGVEPSFKSSCNSFKLAGPISVVAILGFDIGKRSAS